MNSFLNGLKAQTNYGYTENGAIKHNTSGSDLLDMFAQGGAYRSRSDEDCIFLFKKAYEENPTYALKCLFYLYDVRGVGQGERRFFKVCFNWLINNHIEAAKRNLQYIPEYGRWDMLYKVTWGTKLWNEAINLIKQQLMIDMNSFNIGDKTGISLLSKWLPSENTSSKETQKYAKAIRSALGMTSRQYRKTLSVLRERIKVLERLMSSNRWEEIEFDQIPSKAGLKYRNAFARRDMIAKKYEAFAKDKNTKVNAKTLYPYDVVAQAIACHKSMDDTDRLMINKYWDNLSDYLADATLDAMCVCDTSGSMTWGGNAIHPIDIAISLALYCADKARGPFAGHYISFASQPQLIETKGIDFVDKVQHIYRTNLCDNTNIEAVFDLILNMVRSGKCKSEDLPKSLIIVSDMEFDAARGVGYYSRSSTGVRTLMESIEAKWNRYGYKMPNLIFWNCSARNDNIPMETKDGVMFVSGASPVILKQVLTNKDAVSLMMDVLDKERYAPIH